jgi:acetyltransferase-like isoleucine patch superfamily enzyme
MTGRPEISDYIAGWAASPFGAAGEVAWAVTQQAEALLRAAMAGLGPDYDVGGEIVVHRSAIVEPGAVLKGPAIIGPRCFIAAGAYLRGGYFLAEDCIVGPGAELKTSFLFAGSTLAHFNFVGDSILGAGVNIEAGAVIANYRNERADKAISIRLGDAVIETGVEKFGALVGDGVRIGAKAVVAPGAILAPGGDGGAAGVGRSVATGVRAGRAPTGDRAGSMFELISRKDAKAQRRRWIPDQVRGDGCGMLSLAFPFVMPDLIRYPPAFGGCDLRKG